MKMFQRVSIYLRHPSIECSGKSFESFGNETVAYVLRELSGGRNEGFSRRFHARPNRLTIP